MGLGSCIVRIQKDMSLRVRADQHDTEGLMRGVFTFVYVLLTTSVNTTH